MTPSQSPVSIIWLDKTESTNKCIREAFESSDNLSVIAATEQLACRGQGDHTWHSLRGQNLTFSMLFKPSGMEAKDIQLISCAVTLGILDYLKSEGIQNCRIKWPNDIWVGDKKICGILIENILDGTFVKGSIIGIGFNLNQDHWPPELPNPISLKQLSGKCYDPHAELKILTEKICRRLAHTDYDDGRRELQEEFGKNVFRLT